MCWGGWGQGSETGRRLLLSERSASQCISLNAAATLIPSSPERLKPLKQASLVSSPTHRKRRRERTFLQTEGDGAIKAWDTSPLLSYRAITYRPLFWHLVWGVWAGTRCMWEEAIPLWHRWLTYQAALTSTIILETQPPAWWNNTTCGTRNEKVLLLESVLRPPIWRSYLQTWIQKHHRLWEMGGLCSLLR